MPSVPDCQGDRTTDRTTKGEPPVRRILIPVAAILLVSACSGQRAVTQPASSEPTASRSASASSGQKGLIGGAPSPRGRLVVAIPAERLPYKPDAGMPALDDVRVIKTAADPCAIPADNSGEQAQLIGASSGGPGTVNVMFSFTNPCAKPVVFGYKVTAAIGSAKGDQAGGGAEGTTQKIEPGRTVKAVVPVDVSTNLTAAQQKQLWVGCTEIGKQDPGY
ncbi:hypothetical protein [Streptomyces sp. NPDC058086]|uniref:hypothetical protein n=1 Tax=Streptomyces sp. NPDC058086 TaxID=3346334 RepID=UPI0036DFA9D8